METNNEINDRSILIGLILSVILVYGVYALCNYYYFDAKDQEALQLQTDVNQLHISNRELERMKLNIQQLEDDLSRADGEFRALKALVPSESELPKIMNWISNRATERNLKLERFSQVNQAPIANPGALIEMPVEVEISGDFGGISRFVEDFSRYERVLNVRAVHMIQEHEQTANQLTLRATITFSAYRGNDKTMKKAKV